MARISGKNGALYAASQLVENCDDAWDQQVIANVTATTDTDAKVGSASAKFVVAAGFTTGQIASEARAALDISSYTNAMCWVKSSVALNADDYRVQYHNGTGTTAVVAYAIVPALSASTWTLIGPALVTPSSATAVASVSLNQTVDKGAHNFWIDELRAAKATAGIKSWSLDQKTGVVDVTGFDSGGYKMFAATVTEFAGSFEGFKEGAPLTIGADGVYLELQESTTSTQLYRGQVIITGFAPKVDVTDVVRYTYTFQGVHQLTIATA